MTRIPLSRSKGQRSRSPGRFTHRGLNAWGRCSGDRENVLGVGNCCYFASAHRRARRWGAHGGGEGRGISCRHAHSLL